NSSRNETLPDAQTAADVPPPVPAAAITDLVAPPPAQALAPLPDPAPAPVLANDPGAALQPGLAMNPYATPTVVYDSTPNIQVAAPAPVGEGTTPAQAGSGAAGDFASRIGG